MEQYAFTEITLLHKFLIRLMRGTQCASWVVTMEAWVQITGGLGGLSPPEIVLGGLIVLGVPI